MSTDIERIILNMQNEIHSLHEENRKLHKKYKPFVEDAKKILTIMVEIQNKASYIQKRFNEKIKPMKNALKWLNKFDRMRSTILYGLSRELDVS